MEKLQGWKCSSKYCLSATKSKQSSQMWITLGSNLTKAQALVSSHPGPWLLTQSASPLTLRPELFLLRAHISQSNGKNHQQVAQARILAVKCLRNPSTYLALVSRTSTSAPQGWEVTSRLRLLSHLGKKKWSESSLTVLEGTAVSILLVM